MRNLWLVLSHTYWTKVKSKTFFYYDFFDGYFYDYDLEYEYLDELF